MVTLEKVHQGQEALIDSQIQSTINEVYQHYYPKGAVELFLEIHGLKNIQKDIKDGYVYFILADDTVVGTVSVKHNEIYRLFIWNEYQGKGYGHAVMDMLENQLFEEYETITLDASFAAERMYLKRGYKIKEFDKFKTDCGDFLCWHSLELVK